jgi:8-amino-7-oxononanoate synthase
VADVRHDRVSEAAQELLEHLRAQSLYREMRLVEGRAGPHMRVDGRDVLMLAGSNYLDLAAHPVVVNAAQAALGECGVAAGGSRLISGNLAYHERLEAALAELAGMESALVFGSGYLANLGVITALAGPDDLILSDALNHASIIDACRLSHAEVRVFEHNDPASLAELARGAQGYRRRLLIVDGVYSMDGDLARLTDLVPIARAHDMIVIVDDAHGVGVLGPQGGGAVELAGVEVDILIGNLAKAFGSFGAYAACSRAVRELLINTARAFIFTCALPPALAAAALAGVELARAEPARRVAVMSRAAQLRAELAQAGFDTGPSCTHIVPAVVRDARQVMTLCAQALERGVYAQGIRFPAVPHGAERIRFTPMCSHTPAEITQAVDLFADLRLSRA